MPKDALMPNLTDRLTLRFLDDAVVTQLLTTDIGLTPLFNLGYRLEDGTVHGLELVRIARSEFQKPVFQTLHTRGSEDRQGRESTRLNREQPKGGRLEWIDVRFQVVVAAIIEDRFTKVRQITATDLLADLGNPGTLAALRAALVARFGAFAAERTIEALRIDSIEELRQRGALSLKIESETPPPFDPTDPANRRELPLDLCLQVVPGLDITLALRTAKLDRALLEEEERRPGEVAPGIERRRPSVFLVLFPDSAAVDNAIPGLTAAQIKTQTRNLFTREEMAAHFVVGV